MKRWLVVLLGVLGLSLLAGTGVALGAPPPPPPERPFLGVVLGEEEGRVLVRRVLEGSPAQKAGIKEGDVLLALGGEEVGRVEDVLRLLREARPGDVLTVRLLRGEEEREVSITLGERPARRRPLALFPEGKAPPPFPRPFFRPILCRFLPLLCDSPLDRLVRLEVVLTDREGEVRTISALSGTVTARTENSLTVRARDGGEVVASIPPEAAILRGGRHIPLSEVQEGDRVLLWWEEGGLRVVLVASFGPSPLPFPHPGLEEGGAWRERLFRDLQRFFRDGR